MKLQVIGLDSNRFGYVSISCLLPDPKEKIDNMKEMLQGVDKDTAAMIKPLIIGMGPMFDAMNQTQEKMLRLPMEWEEFIKLDLRLGDYLELEIKRAKK